MDMNSSLSAAVRDFIAHEHLPDDYLETVRHWFMPVLEQILGRLAVRHEPLVVGVSGSQGSGKSTLAALLVVLLRESMGIKAVNLSIDDFYLTHAERQNLAAEVHPLLATRGVPGTHDVALALNTLLALKQSGEVPVPRFDKAHDDRAPVTQWPRIQAPVDVIILEGWCLCVGPQDEHDLEQSVNELERDEDADLVWRRYVNLALASRYAALFDMVDFLIMLKAPSFEQVYQWRQTQEDKLARRAAGSGTRIMNAAQLRRFIQHYERITRHALASLPARADVVFHLSEAQKIVASQEGRP